MGRTAVLSFLNQVLFASKNVCEEWSKPFRCFAIRGCIAHNGRDHSTDLRRVNRVLKKNSNWLKKGLAAQFTRTPSC